MMQLVRGALAQPAASSVPAGPKNDRPPHEGAPVNTKTGGSQQAPPKAEAMHSEYMQELEKRVQNVSRDLQFSVDQDSGKTVIKVLDSRTKEIIRQIPFENYHEAVGANLSKQNGMIFTSEV